MQMNAWFAIPQQLHVEAVTFEHGGVTFLTSTQDPEAKYPACGYLSRRLHS